ncbi:hypothetical protein D3C80_2123030 [compost metagenome]
MNCSLWSVCGAARNAAWVTASMAAWSDGVSERTWKVMRMSIDIAAPADRKTRSFLAHLAGRVDG